MGEERRGGEGGGGGRGRRGGIAGGPTVNIGLVIPAVEHAEFCLANRGTVASGEFGGKGGRVSKSGMRESKKEGSVAEALPVGGGWSARFGNARNLFQRVFMLLTLFLPTCTHIQMPKWKYRVMVSSIIFLLVSLAILLFVSVVYGFGMSLPHIQVHLISFIPPLF